ncbi:hypothetical protein M758_12G192500 [Ceratodon purpureus]|nr:hypothetical protein M758_12G192500 [Ceratodon purpureus]
MTENQDQQWGKYSADYNSGAWVKDAVEAPFLEGHFKSFAQKALDRGKPWKALDIGCGMGRYTIRLLQAGASYVLASDADVDMVSGAKKETEQYLIGRSGPGTPKADFYVCSAAHLTSISRIEEGTFDLAISIYVLCNLPSTKDALREISKLLRPGGTFIFYEPHIVEYMTMTNSTGHVEYLPKDDGTEYKYFEDEGKPQTLRIRMNSGNPIEITNRFYTLSFWVTSLLEVGFQISQFHEPHGNPKDFPSDAPSYMRYYAECPSAMVWVCTNVPQ